MGKIIRETKRYCNFWRQDPVYIRTVIYYKNFFGKKIPLFTYIKVPHYPVKEIIIDFPPMTHIRDDDTEGSFNWCRNNPITKRRFHFYYIKEYEVLNKTLLDKLYEERNTPSRW